MPAAAARRLACGAAFALALGGPAWAQVQDADDAFGQRAGVEQAGLYNEGAARGFDLGNTNVYRIDDTFFVRTAPLPDPLISRVSVKAGVAAARTAFPSPSGVIEYSLRRPTGTEATLATGFRDYGSFFVDANASAVAGGLSIAGGALVQPDLTFADGTRGSYDDYGAVARGVWKDRLELAGFASHSKRLYAGSFGFTSSNPDLPEVPPMSESFSPPWAKYRASIGNHGVILASKLAGNLSLRVSAHRASSSSSISDFTLFRLEENGAAATLFRTAPRRVVGIGIESRIERRFGAGPIRHTVSLTARSRASSARSVRSAAVQLGLIDLSNREYPAEPLDLPPQPSTLDRIDQRTFTAAYGLQASNRVELRAGLSSARSVKEVTRQNEAPISDSSSYLLPFGSAIWSPWSNASFFVSYVSGLEDTGLAPQGARNANEVLPPVRSEQFELGVRLALRKGLSASLAGFNISKRVPGLDAARDYRFIGQARHRGVEAALAGAIGRTSVLLGLALMEARVQRPEGAIVPPGVSEQIGFLRVEQPLSQRLRVDAQVSHQGPRFLDVANTVRTESHTIFGAGLRYQARLATTPVELRLSGSNLLNTLKWVATPSGILLRIPPRSLRAFLVFSL